MAVVLMLHDEGDVEALAPLALHFARAADEDLVLLHAPGSKEDRETVEIDLAAAPEDDAVARAAAALLSASGFTPHAVAEDDAPPSDEKPDPEAPAPPHTVTLLRSRSTDRVATTLKILKSEKASLFLLPHRDEEARDAHADTRTLFRRAPCVTMWLRPGESDPAKCPRVLVPAGGGPHAIAALKLARSLQACGGEEATALLIQPDIGSLSRLVARRTLRGIVQKAGGDPDVEEGQVVVSDQVLAGITEVADAGEHDLVLVGASHRGLLRSRLSGTVPGRLLTRTEGPPVGIVRDAIPIAGRARAAIEHLLSGHVPQLEREGRVALVERVQSNSHWDFDFVALVCLSTAIASFGLVQDSAAVVIGAMLIAPLMTPLVGIGLALAQANLRLLSNASRAVTNGFLLAFGIGALLGLVAGEEITAQMAARGSPGLVDLAVAFVSGVAAAYASSRPNLSAALPGVAIAAALVPPTATSGLALTIGSPSVALGAALLFTTNIIAIVLGSAAALWAVGVRGEHEHGRVAGWVWSAATILILVSVGIAAPLSVGVEAPVVNVAPPAASPALAALLRERVDAIDGARVTSITPAGPGEPGLLVVRVQAPAQLSPALADDLGEIASEGGGPWSRVRVVVELAYESD